MPIRVLGVGGGNSFDIAEGIRYAARLPNTSGTVPPMRANVVNMSLGPGNVTCMPLAAVDRGISDALESATAAGVVVVVAAGNDNCHQPVPMSTVDRVISVGATDHFGRAPYSNFGPTVDVVAPGGNMGVDQNGDGYGDGILSTAGAGSGADSRHIYDFAHGTSMAAPHVAGVVALMFSVNPDLTPLDVDRLLAGNHRHPSAAPISRDWGTPGRDDEYGHGLIDAYHAVRVAQAIEGGGGHENTERPMLTVSPTRLHFGATTDVLRVRLINSGTGALNVWTIQPDESWISVSSVEWPTVTVRVDRAGLAEATHLGSIDITSDGGDLTIPLTVQVQRRMIATDVGTVYVVAFDRQTSENLGQAMTSVRNGYSYELPTLPAGVYGVAAGTDRDNDGYICDSGEACGIWPLLDSPGPIDLDGDRRVDFGVSIDLFAEVSSQSFAADSVPAQGFPIRPIKRIAADARAVEPSE